MIVSLEMKQRNRHFRKQSVKRSKVLSKTSVSFDSFVCGETWNILTQLSSSKIGKYLSLSYSSTLML